jgi:hypothetical protein
LALCCCGRFGSGTLRLKSRGFLLGGSGRRSGLPCRFLFGHLLLLGLGLTLGLLLGGSLTRGFLALCFQTLGFLLHGRDSGSLLSGRLQTRGFLLNCCNACGFLAGRFYAQGILARCLLPNDFLTQDFRPLGLQARSFLLDCGLPCVLQARRFLQRRSSFCFLA